MKKLTILIPSRNRPEKVELQARIILERTKSYQEFVQVVISDNSDTPLERVNFDERIKIIRAPERFSTFEEHFFWAIKKLNSEFVWTLGDDDEPQSKTIDLLMKNLLANKHDIILFNGWRETKKGSLVQMIPCSQDYLEVPYKNFLMSAGIWGIGAGISLCVFRLGLIKNDYLTEIEKIGSPIYSHVTLFLRSFNTSSFIFINSPLVKYRRSDPDAQVKRSGNWEQYSINSKRFYRYPWTVGFLKQINYLVKANCISVSEFTQVLEFDAETNRYFLLDSLEVMLLEELEHSFFSKANGKLNLSKSDIKFLVSNRICGQVLNEELTSIMRKIDLKALHQTKGLKSQLQSLQSNSHSRLNNYEKRFLVKKHLDHSEFMTPKGLVEIGDRYRKLNNLILKIECSTIDTKHSSLLPNIKNTINTQPIRARVLNDIKILLFLFRHHAGRRFIQERLYIFLRGIWIRSGLKGRPNRILKSLLQGKFWKSIFVGRLNLKTIRGGIFLIKAFLLQLKFSALRIFWRITSFVWGKLPLNIRILLKKILAR